ncbi:MAG: helix-turn-helix domain-containing protein [Dorea sp.]
MRNKRPYKAITFKERQEIEEKVKAGKNPKEIAEAAGVHISTIYRELKRGQTEDGYKAIKAQCEITR